MKPIHLNLAARPYRDYRPVYVVVVLASLLTFFLGLYNVDTFVRYRTETVSTRAQIDKLESDITTEQKLADDAAQRVRTFNVVALEKQTKFVNAQIAQRAFSWSELLDRLESVLANNTRITQITPSFDKSGNTIHLELACEAKTSAALEGMLRRFQSDPHFSKPFPRVESATPTGFTFTVGVEYQPAVPRVSLQ